MTAVLARERSFTVALTLPPPVASRRERERKVSRARLSMKGLVGEEGGGFDGVEQHQSR